MTTPTLDVETLVKDALHNLAIYSTTSDMTIVSDARKGITTLSVLAADDPSIMPVSSALWAITLYLQRLVVDRARDDSE